MEQTNENAVTQVTDEQLAELVAQNSKLQKQEMAGDGLQADFIILAKTGTKALNPTEKEYIEGLSIGQFFLQTEKNFGKRT